MTKINDRIKINEVLDRLNAIKEKNNWMIGYNAIFFLI
jgi:hypothetical protein